MLRQIKLSAKDRRDAVITSNNKKLLKISVGVIVNSQNEVLLALRPGHVDQGGLWEFPGGKIEADETPYQALCRELKEEIDIDLVTAEKLIDVEHEYPTHRVILYTFLISDYRGEPRGLQGQPLKWVTIRDLENLAVPAANLQIIQALQNKVR